jgi:hypothetical protein
MNIGMRGMPEINGTNPAGRLPHQMPPDLPSEMPPDLP